MRGCISAGHPETAKAGAVILEAGGNAFDAAMSAMLASCVTEPVLNSLGGGGFLLAHPQKQHPVIYDFFAQTPQLCPPQDELDFHASSCNFGTVSQEFHIGHGSMATPGTVAGLFAIHCELGKLPMAEIIKPAVSLARRGVELDSLQAYIISVVAPIFLSTAGSRELYESKTHPGSQITHKEILKNPAYADVLEAMAKEGASVFYQGEIAGKIMDACRLNGGALTQSDFSEYKVHRRKPLRIEYGNAQIYTNPPPSTGGLLIGFALELLKKLELSKYKHGSFEHVWHLMEVMELTNKARIEKKLHNMDADQAASQMLDPEFLDLYRTQISGSPASFRGTTHISVIDGDQNAASLTLSNGEGCGFVVPGTGIMMNNMLGEEDINPSGLGQWPTNKRMTSMMAPTLLEMEELGTIVLGSGGSNRIRTAILQVLVNILDFSLPLSEAVQFPRFHFEKEDLNIEAGYALDVVQALSRNTQNFKNWEHKNMFFGGVHAVQYKSKLKTFVGQGDSRRGGKAILAG